MQLADVARGVGIAPRGVADGFVAKLRAFVDGETKVGAGKLAAVGNVYPVFVVVQHEVSGGLLPILRVTSSTVGF